MTTTHPTQPRTFGDVLTCAFGATVVMWAVGFFARLPVGGSLDAPEVLVSSPVLMVLMLLVLVGGGAAIARYTQRGVVGGLQVGFIAGVLNLLVVGGVLEGGSTQQTAQNAMIWIPGMLGVAMVACALGAAVARLFGAAPSAKTSRGLQSARTFESDDAPVAYASHFASQRDNWLAPFAAVGALATLLLLMVGGMVTGYDAGLAVVDWPNTEGYFMFLYPLAKMTGGIYFEHSHRLIGSLVGLTTVVLAIYLQIAAKQHWLKTLGWAAVAMVVAQGILGGLRVTGKPTLSTDPADTDPSILLAIIHGVFGQVYFSVMVALAVFTRTAYRQATPQPAVTATMDRQLTIVLYVMLVLQLVLGALVRHLMSITDMVESGWVDRLILVHITFAVLVTLAAIGTGLRGWGLYPHVPRLSQLGLWLLGLMLVQVLLGIGSYIAVYGGSAQPHTAKGWHVLITTAHQTTGALLLAVTVMLLLWNYRLLSPAASDEPAAEPQTA